MANTSLVVAISMERAVRLRSLVLIAGGTVQYSLLNTAEPERNTKAVAYHLPRHHSELLRCTSFPKGLQHQFERTKRVCGPVNTIFERAS